MEKYKIFVGIDISKGWIDVVALNQSGSAHRNFGNTKKEYKLMLSWLKTFSKPHEMLLCMEHTGVYGMPLWNYLTMHKIPFVVESGLQIQHSMGIRRGKSDKADASMIARYIKLHHSEVRLYQVAPQVISRLKAAFSYRERLVKVKHQLSVAAKETGEFMARDLINEINRDSDTLVKIINTRIAKVEKVILDIIMSNEDTKRIYKLVVSIPGVALVTATYLIIITRNFTIMETSRKLSRFGGMSPEKDESGIIKKKSKVSMIGNKKIKTLLTNCISSNMRHDNETKEYFNRKLKEGKPQGIIKNNLKNKLLHRVYAVVNRGTNYVDIRKYAA